MLLLFRKNDENLKPEYIFIYNFYFYLIIIMIRLSSVQIYYKDENELSLPNVYLQIEYIYYR